MAVIHMLRGIAQVDFPCLPPPHIYCFLPLFTELACTVVFVAPRVDYLSLV